MAARGVCRESSADRNARPCSAVALASVTELGTSNGEPMSKFIAVVITAAICLPLGALLRGEASAERRYTFITGGFGMIEGHPHLGRAQAALYEALTRR